MIGLKILLKYLINSQNIEPNDEIINSFNQGKFQEVISLCYKVLEKHPQREAKREQGNMV